jgi:hypothetical protein
VALLVDVAIQLVLLALNEAALAPVDATVVFAGITTILRDVAGPRPQAPSLALRKITLVSAFGRHTSCHPVDAPRWRPIGQNAYNVDRKLLLERNRLALLDHHTYRDVRLYEAVRPARGGCFDAGSYLFFDRAVLTAMREAGRRSAEIWLAAGPRIDRIEEPEDAYDRRRHDRQREESHDRSDASGSARPEPMAEGVGEDGRCGRAIEVLEVDDEVVEAGIGDVCVELAADERRS